jgi:hypothetical protein
MGRPPPPLRPDILAALLEAEHRAQESVEKTFIRLLAAQETNLTTPK